MVSKAMRLTSQYVRRYRFSVQAKVSERYCLVLAFQNFLWFINNANQCGDGFSHAAKYVLVLCSHVPELNSSLTWPVDGNFYSLGWNFTWYLKFKIFDAQDWAKGYLQLCPTRYERWKTTIESFAKKSQLGNYIPVTIFKGQYQKI